LRPPFYLLLFTNEKMMSNLKISCIGGASLLTNTILYLSIEHCKILKNLCIEYVNHLSSMCKKNAKKVLYLNSIRTKIENIESEKYYFWVF
jgi:hypothetical protein